jgi:cytidylate kinase
VGTVTVSRQFGAGGRRVAPALAEALGYRFVDREIVEEAARRLDVDPRVAAERDERTPALVEEIGMALAQGTPEFGFTPAHIGDRELAEATRAVIESLAQAGGFVILGRGGQAILRPRADAVHLWLVGELADRARRVAESQGIDQRSAVELCQRMDAERAAYVSRYYRCDITDPLLYDLVLNTTALGTDGAADVATRACRRRLGR